MAYYRSLQKCHWSVYLCFYLVLNNITWKINTIVNTKKEHLITVLTLDEYLSLLCTLRWMEIKTWTSFLVIILDQHHGFFGICWNHFWLKAQKGIDINFLVSLGAARLLTSLSFSYMYFTKWFSWVQVWFSPHLFLCFCLQVS